MLSSNACIDSIKRKHPTCGLLHQIPEVVRNETGYRVVVRLILLFLFCHYSDTEGPLTLRLQCTICPQHFTALHSDKIRLIYGRVKFEDAGYYYFRAVRRDDGGVTGSMAMIIYCTSSSIDVTMAGDWEGVVVLRILAKTCRSYPARKPSVCQLALEGGQRARETQASGRSFATNCKAPSYLAGLVIPPKFGLQGGSHPCSAYVA